MKKFMLAFAFAFSFIPYAFASIDSAANSKLKFAASDLGFADRVATQHLQVLPGNISGFSSKPQELANMEEAFRIVEAVINSDEFKQKVINFVNKSGARSYTNNKGLTNEQVYEAIMAGNEIIGGANTPGQMNFDVSRYVKSWSKVIGYTSPGKSNTIFVNGKFYSGFKPSEISSNVTHEWLHLCGFVHSSASDHDSVPYAVGYIMKDLAAKLLKQGFLN